jgi:glycosyltransferase involved in cell wall biosynthesis
LLLLATGLDPDRYRAIVALPDEGPLADDLREAGVELHVRPLAVLRRALMSPSGMGRVGAAWAADAGGLGRLARTRGVALVHTNTSVTLGGAAVARIAGTPHVWHVREIYTGFERWWPAYRRLLTTADALPCVSAATAAQFERGPVRVIHDGLGVIPDRAPRELARATLGVPGDAYAVALLGRISPWKGQDVLIRAIAEMPGAVAMIAGSAWRTEQRLERELHELAASLGVADRVYFLGFRDDVDTVLGAADVVAVASTDPDPLPNAAIEASAAGCCVVASATGGLPEIVVPERTGVLVAPNDPAALAVALTELREQPERREALGAAARERVCSLFAPDRLLDEVQGLYDELLS